ncbi:hypothetical protein ASG43_03300 [Aureimonas sp. Leaf454]|uniref:DUF4376 domain-containing protein n=1 Tax=Aureimonas sp. Leaf454 TaxID=1736381 RepID=UPI0006F43CD1|nr:DUF4376 domain-containing protein [Aureimonas sp. Leaf454]KQT54626.1 hypothetical protein ASG43_03300 [Aureimonas sp. Leaf454]
MNYRLRANGRYPLTAEDIRETASALFGATPPLDVLEKVGADIVQPTTMPGFDLLTEVVIEGPPKKTDGVWRQTWIVTTKPGPESRDINAERDRRIRAGFTFEGVAFDYDDASQKRITGAATLAGFAVAAGSLPGDLRWHGGTSDFVWIARDNTLVPMDARKCFAFGEAAAAQESAIIFAAKAIKETSPAPSDFAHDRYWPS